jgi:hypothetical protein
MILPVKRLISNGASPRAPAGEFTGAKNYLFLLPVFLMCSSRKIYELFALLELIRNDRTTLGRM